MRRSQLPPWIKERLASESRAITPDAPRARRPRPVKSDRVPANRGVAPWIEAAAKLAGADPRAVRDAYRARQSRVIPREWDRDIMRAVQWLEMHEAGLEQHIYLDTKAANVLSDANKDVPQPRFTYYHTKKSRFSPRGFPDDWLLDRYLNILNVWENKREEGHTTPDQDFWLDGLSKVPGLRVFGVVRPSTWYTSVRKAVLELP